MGFPSVASPVQLGNPWRENVFLELASKWPNSVRTLGRN